MKKEKTRVVQLSNGITTKFSPDGVITRWFQDGSCAVWETDGTFTSHDRDTMKNKYPDHPEYKEET